jgi:CheY-like chemotaxis protein
MLDIDYARAVQIYANILSNAVKFTPQGGNVVVRATVDDDGALLVSVRDSGIGLDAETIPRIFHMFEQSNTVSGQFSSGLGIGLSLSRQFAEMHGGTVDARSDGPGTGSEFLIRLPVVSRDSARNAVPQSLAAGADGRKMKVLVVDDNQDAADSLAALLEIDGFDAHAVYDGEAAISGDGAVAAGHHHPRPRHARHGRLRDRPRDPPARRRRPHPDAGPDRLGPERCAPAHAGSGLRSSPGQASGTGLGQIVRLAGARKSTASRSRRRAESAAA